MTPQATSSAPVNGASSAHELFSLTDEQILEIEPADANDTATVEQPLLLAPSSEGAVPAHNDGKDNAIQGSDRSAASTKFQVKDKPAQAGVPVLLEPPAWLAAQMKDPWAGAEARELWEGVQHAQAEAAEYRAAIATPAEAKSLKEIYPGGVEQARSAAERARALDDFDAAYFGTAGKSAEELNAGRTALAQRMLREDPAAFAEMVAAGVKALQTMGRGDSSVAAVFRPRDLASANEAQKPAPQPAQEKFPPSEEGGYITAYTAFEKAANADLEKSVGATIDRALQQALPNAGRDDSDGLKLRLATGVRQEIEKALQGDRQLGEQVAQVLAARRFDEMACAQVVRLINERAQQLVPSATKRVLHDWTQTTLAAHRSKTEKQETASQRADLSPAQQGRKPAEAGSQQRIASRADAPASSRGRIDYKKLSDEQILDL